MKKTKWLFWLIQGAIVVVVNPLNIEVVPAYVISHLAAEQMTPEQEVSLFNLIGYTEEGKKKWEIFGKSAVMAEQLIHLDGILAKVYGEDEGTTLRAKKGTYDEEAKKVHLEEDVVITNAEGAVLETEALDWDADADKVTSEAPVKIVRDDIIATGLGAEAHPRLKTAVLKKDVKVDVNQATEITCDGPLEVDQNKNLAIFRENVVITDKEGQIQADLVIAHFDRESQAITEVEAEGNVVIIRGDNRSFSDRLLYDHRTGKVTLLGKPKLYIIPGKDDKSEFITN